MARDYYARFKKLPRNAKRHPTDKTLQWDMMLGRAIVRWHTSKAFEENKLYRQSPSHQKRNAFGQLLSYWSSGRSGGCCANGLKALVILESKLAESFCGTTFLLRTQVCDRVKQTT